jgi:hypothetical protein
MSPTGWCYTPRQEARTFEEAEHVCRAWGGHVFSYQDQVLLLYHSICIIFVFVYMCMHHALSLSYSWHRVCVCVCVRARAYTRTCIPSTCMHVRVNICT